MPAHNHNPRFFVNVYYRKQRDIGSRPFETSLHKTRDGLPIAELSSVLYDNGYAYGGAILNIPSRFREYLSANDKIESTQPPLNSDDLVLLCTRPPLDDEANLVKKRIERSQTEFEDHVVASLRMFFRTCDRSQVVLSSQIVPNGGGHSFHEYRAVHFREYRGGKVLKMNALDDPRDPLDEGFTIGYLLTSPRVSPIGFRLIAAFGMGGAETLWFTHHHLCLGCPK